MKYARLVSIALVSLSIWILAGVPLAAATGTGPDDALVPTGQWTPLHPGETHWYAFYYAGGDSPIDVRLQVEPHEGAAFAIWTPAEIRSWADGAEVDPIGRGSPHPRTEGLLTWSGSFTFPGTYYVVVEHGGSKPGPSYYLLELSGDGVSLSAPAAAPPPEAKTKPKPAAPSKPAGKLVFQTTFGGDLYTINVDGSNLQRVTDGIDPIWSPDGRQIAFTRWREPRGLWVIDADGSGEWRAFDWDRARWPSWASDASHLLLSRMTGKGRQDETEFCFRGFCFSFPAHPHWRLGLVRLQDSSFREPPSSEIAHAPHWYPGGSSEGGQVVYDDVQGLRVQTLDGEVSYLITHDPRDTGPVWSPDGGRVAFVHRQHDHWEVYVVDADGRNPRRLTDTPMKPNGQPGSSAAPAWSPDGQHIGFLTDRSGKWEIWVMRANGSQARPMFDDELDGLALEYGNVADRAISWTK